jgi:hypothetical protein
VGREQISFGGEGVITGPKYRPRLRAMLRIRIRKDQHHFAGYVPTFFCGEFGFTVLESTSWNSLHTRPRTVRKYHAMRNTSDIPENLTELLAEVQ